MPGIGSLLVGSNGSIYLSVFIEDVVSAWNHIRQLDLRQLADLLLPGTPPADGPALSDVQFLRRTR